MCKVRTGADVQTTADLQNLVTSVILRQTHPFSKDRKKQTQVIKICERTLKLMVLSSSIKSKGMDNDCYHLALSFPSYNPSMMSVK